MAVPTTASFALDVEGAVDAAYARIGGEKVTGAAARSSLRAIQLLLTSWHNRGIALWTVEAATLALVAGTAAYTLPADTIDVLEVTLRAHGTDLPIERIGRTPYTQIPDKDAPGRPVQIWVDRQRDAPVVTMYPVPDTAGLELRYWRVRRYRDVVGMASGLDLPARFYPALVSGLAWYLARERAEIGEEKLARLRQEYEADFAEASEQDIDRAPFRAVPDLSAYW